MIQFQFGQHFTCHMCSRVIHTAITDQHGHYWCEPCATQRQLDQAEGVASTQLAEPESDLVNTRWIDYEAGNALTVINHVRGSVQVRLDDCQQPVLMSEARLRANWEPIPAQPKSQVAEPKLPPALQSILDTQLRAQPEEPLRAAGEPQVSQLWSHRTLQMQVVIRSVTSLGGKAVQFQRAKGLYVDPHVQSLPLSQFQSEYARA